MATSHVVLNLKVKKDGTTLTTANFGVGHLDANGKVTVAKGDEKHTMTFTETYEPETWGQTGRTPITFSRYRNYGTKQAIASRLSLSQKTEENLGAANLGTGGTNPLTEQT